MTIIHVHLQTYGWLQAHTPPLTHSEHTQSNVVIIQQPCTRFCSPFYESHNVHALVETVLELCWFNFTAILEAVDSDAAELYPRTLRAVSNISSTFTDINENLQNDHRVESTPLFKKKQKQNKPQQKLSNMNFIKGGFLAALLYWTAFTSAWWT